MYYKNHYTNQIYIGEHTIYPVFILFREQKVQYALYAATINE